MRQPDLTKEQMVIVIPGVTDLNRGDQALVWEAVSLTQEMNIGDSVMLLDDGEGVEERELQVGQTRKLGHKLVRSILRHPRRGRHRQEDKIKESPLSFILMAVHGLFDFFWGQGVLLLAPFSKLVWIFLDTEQYEAYLVFKNARAIVVKGGGFLHTYGGLTAPYYIWYQLFYFRLAQRLKKPVIVLPNSFGPFEGFGVRHQIKNVLSRCLFVSARETISSKMLGDVLGTTVPTFPDMGYYLKPASRETGETICQQFGIPLGSKKCVAFTLRPYRFSGAPDPTASFSRYLDAMAELIEHVAAKGFHPVFVTHVAGPSAHENDRLAIEEVRTRLHNVEHSWIDFDGDCRDIKAVYGCMDYLVGTRFHSVIFAQAAGVPCLAIAYGGNKSLGIMADMELGDYAIAIEEVTGKILCSRFDLLLNNTEEVKKKMYLWKEHTWKQRKVMMTCIGSRLNKSTGG